MNKCVCVGGGGCVRAHTFKKEAKPGFSTGSFPSIPGPPPDQLKGPQSPFSPISSPHCILATGPLRARTACSLY